jgi:hypothetical protein
MRLTIVKMSVPLAAPGKDTIKERERPDYWYDVVGKKHW